MFYEFLDDACILICHLTGKPIFRLDDIVFWLQLWIYTHIRRVRAVLKFSKGFGEHPRSLIPSFDLSEADIRPFSKARSIPIHSGRGDTLDLLLSIG